ncbi:MAG: tryptophan synthase alpha chain [Verrucomicrobiales bacterium]|jgi:tryptophan synthase alpha chain
MSTSLNRIESTFKNLKAEGKKAFVAYVCAGDPDMDGALEVVKGLDDAGADVIELGVPFSDPLADGVVNQMAAQRALEAGTTTAKVLDFVRAIRAISQTPIVLFTYLNPVYAYGFKQFYTDAAEAGVDGILLLDLPPDEAKLNEELCGQGDALQQIRLVSPTTPASRIPSLVAEAQGFIYYVSREGVTGEQTTLSDSIGSQVELIKKSTDVPVAVGFGISTPDQARTVATMADAVVVGSAIVRLIAATKAKEELRQAVCGFVKPLVDAVKSV